MTAHSDLLPSFIHVLLFTSYPLFNVSIKGFMHMAAFNLHSNHEVVQMRKLRSWEVKKFTEDHRGNE